MKTHITNFFSQYLKIEIISNTVFNNLIFYFNWYNTFTPTNNILQLVLTKPLSFYHFISDENIKIILFSISTEARKFFPSSHHIQFLLLPTHWKFELNLSTYFYVEHPTTFPVDTGRKLNVHKTFNLCPVFTGFLP